MEHITKKVIISFYLGLLTPHTEGVSSFLQQGATITELISEHRPPLTQPMVLPLVCSHSHNHHFPPHSVNATASTHGSVASRAKSPRWRNAISPSPLLDKLAPRARSSLWAILWVSNSKEVVSKLKNPKEKKTSIIKCLKYKTSEGAWFYFH